jgi:mRNA interferase MazF
MSTTGIEPGDLYLAQIPFTSGEPGKVRPVAVLWLDGEDCVVSSVTSAPPRGLRDVVLRDWMSEGLLRPSTCRLGRLNTMQQKLLTRSLGHLSQDDARELLRVWRLHIRPAWYASAP